MRIDSHAHIFNLRTVFTAETLHILLSRLKIDGMPKSILDVLHEQLEKYLNYEIEAEAIFSKIDDKYNATKELQDVFRQLRVGDASLDIQIDGVLAKLSKVVADDLRDRLLDLYDLDENGEIKQNWVDYIEYLRIALLPTIEKVANEAMRHMEEDDALVALMMDITGGGDDDALIKKQIQATSDAVLAYPGRLFPFFMVNPLRPTHYELLKDAIENRGFWGVKLYPSLGYPVDSTEMRAVLNYCVGNNIPILTHCTNSGFNKNDQTANLAAPGLWGELLKADEYRKLKICFGHFGGDLSLIQPQIVAGSWTQTIIDLMQSHEGVYADLAFHDGPMLGGSGLSKEAARENYKRNIGNLLALPKVKDRILFGTDYWMVRTVTDNGDYWAFFKKILVGAQFKRITETNPATYLGLPGSAVPADRLIRHHVNFFKSKKMRVQRKPAKWLADVFGAEGEPGSSFVVIGNSPTWSRNNPTHLILYEYLKSKQFREADIAGNLPFEEHGRFKLANLRYWDQSTESIIFETAVRKVASDINKMYKVRYVKWVCYNTTNGITEKIAQVRLIAALSKADWYVYQLAELCDSLYTYSTKLPGGGK